MESPSSPLTQGKSAPAWAVGGVVVLAAVAVGLGISLAVAAVADGPSFLLALAPFALVGAGVLFAQPAVAVALYVGSLWSLEIQSIPLGIPFLTASKIVVLLAFAGWLVQLLFRGPQQPAIRIPDPVLAYLPFVVWGAVVSLLFAADRVESLRWLIGMVTLPLTCVLIVNVCDRRWRTRLVVGAFLFTGVAASAITVFEGVTHVSLVGARLGGAKDIIRGGSTVGTANDMGFLLVKVLFIPLVLLLADRHALRRMLWLLLSGLVFGSILFIQTRAAYLAVALGMVLLFVYLPSRLRARVVVLALVGAVAFFSYPKSRDRMLTLLGYRSLEVDVGSARESVSKRAKMLYIGRDLWLEHPLTGVGINNVRYHMPRYGQRYAIAGASSTVVLENSFLQAAAETGLPGLLLFCGFFLVTLRYLHRALMRSRGSPEGLLVTGVGLGLVASLLFFFLSTLYEDNVFWAALAMVEILRRPSDPAAAAPQ